MPSELYRIEKGVFNTFMKDRATKIYLKKQNTLNPDYEFRKYIIENMEWTDIQKEFAKENNLLKKESVETKKNKLNGEMMNKFKESLLKKMQAKYGFPDNKINEKVYKSKSVLKSRNGGSPRTQHFNQDRNRSFTSAP